MANLVPPATSARPAPIRLPLREIVPWALFAVVLGLTILYFVGAEQGATSLFSGSAIHEFMHDGRHIVGSPCH
ncbi:CbtB domain-containing protein [Actinomadura sp. 7K534]|uniref:CbtB domain-containing protein n=1 Tax=Actinomadura TaxID=1988 RepID=UPI001048596F|nr:CbtB domain-containing protein [Actinomadura sp. 7K534]TDB94952.1 CbtB-domain containing protein [Actinomadura sp. 7K534]